MASDPRTLSAAGFTTRPQLAGSFGMVASTHWLASAAGMAALEAGGNAFDAAAAAGFTLQVVEPHLNGPGGDMPLIFAGAGDAEATVLSGQGPAPAGATREHYLAEGLTLIPDNGLLAAAIPGTTDAWLTLLRDRGTLPLREILTYAIHYAREGQPILDTTCDTIADVADLFRAAWTTSADVWLPGGRVPDPGTRFRNAVLAGTWERLLREAEAGAGPSSTGGRDGVGGPDRAEQMERARLAWNRGFVADAIDRFARQPVLDSSGSTHAGVLTGQDMWGYASPYETPLTYDFRGWTVCKTRAWGQGPVLLQQLALLDGFPARMLRHGSAEMVHTVVECAKLAFADREAWYGDDPAVPSADLLARDYTDARRALVGPTASMELRPGSPGGRRPVLPAVLSEPFSAAAGPGGGDPTLKVRRPAGEPTLAGLARRSKGDTCHLDVVDRWGNMVSATPSGGWLQSSPAIPELGFCLGTRLQMFWLEPGLPNSLAPGKRPRTTLTPSLAFHHGEAALSFGTPGGDQQDQWQIPFFLAHVVSGMNLQAAIDAPTWHTTHFPSSFYPRGSAPGEIVVESRLGARTIDALRRRGHKVKVVGPWTLERISSVARDARTGMLYGAANARGMQGYAAGR
jgi:gamma-glutamyltranspeptidase/glutathione hydrolase